MDKKISISVNKYPYLLWLNYFTEVDINKEEQIVVGVRSSRYAKANIFEILFLKYIILLPLFFMMKIPSMDEMIPLLFGFVFCVLFFFLFKRSIVLFKYVGLAFSVSIVLMVLFGYLQGRVANDFLQYFVIFFIIGYVVYDYNRKNFKNYYKLLDINNSGKVNVAKKSDTKKLKIPFTQKYLIKGKRGMNISFDYNFKGHYFYILKEDNHQGDENEI